MNLKGSDNISGERDNSAVSINMFRERMKPVASSEGVNIYCPENGRFSFFNSPYPAHCSFAGIDIYPKIDFGDVAPSPIMGKVTRIRRVKCPKGKMFEGSIYDYVILLRNLENPERWVKILHVEPLVKVGDIVEPGEDLGVLLRSGFFDFWTDPHVHVEVRKPSDPIRARGGFKLERLIKIDAAEPLKKLSGTVVESKPEYSLIALNERFEQGIPVDIDGHIGLLDAGIPHYRWIGIHTNINLPFGGIIRLCNREIGTVKSIHSNMCIAHCCSPVFILNGRPVGLSLYLYPFSLPLVKIVPRRPGRLNLKKLKEVSVVIS